MAQATNEQLLEAAKSGDYSAIMNTPDRYGQIPANMTTARDQLKSLQSQGAKLLKVEKAMQGVTTGDYSGADRNAPMLYGTNTDYDRTLGSGSADRGGGTSNKGYAVYNSVTDVNGDQYVAVSGKNSSFINKISADGTVERVVKPPAKDNKRNTNINRVLGAFEDLKSTLDLSTPADETPVDEVPVDEVPVDEVPVDELPVDEVPVDDDIPVVEEPVEIPLDSEFAGENFTSTIPPAEVIEIGPGEVAPIDPNVSQTVLQDVAPVTYQTGGTGGSTYVPQTVKAMNTSITSPTTGYVPGNVAPQANVTGTFTQPAATAGLSAVPAQISYKTQYAGTQGAVPEGLVTSAPGTGQKIQSGLPTTAVYK